MAAQGTSAESMCSIRKVQSGRNAGLTLLVVIVAELKRAVAAEQRYEYLKHCGPTEPVTAPSRVVFDEFYSFEGTTEPRRSANRSPWRVRRQSTSPARHSAVASI